MEPIHAVTVGVLALQGAFSEHVQLLRAGFAILNAEDAGEIKWRCIEVRTSQQLGEVDALVIPGGESTTMALVAARSGLLEPLRDFVKVQRKLTWGTCAGMILLAEAANRTKQNGQELIGGLDVRVNRNHFGRQVESFEMNIKLPFLSQEEETSTSETNQPFNAVFIRAPIVEKILPAKDGAHDDEAKENVVIAPSKTPDTEVPLWKIKSGVEILATLPHRNRLTKDSVNVELDHDEDIIAVKQGNVFATSFHPELTDDARIHVWWLRQVQEALTRSKA